MKKTLSFLFTGIITSCYSATGSASDGELLALSVLVIMSLILGTGYFIDYLKHVIKAALTKRWARKHKTDDEFDTTSLHKNFHFS